MENSVFDGIGVNAAPVTNTEDANTAKKAKIEKMKQSLKETMKSDPTFSTRLHSLSGSLEVVNSLGFGENGNIIVDKTKTEAGNRVLTTTSVIVGYRVKNIGSQPIQYTTEVYTQDAEGKYVGEKVAKTLVPGGYADLPRMYMTMFCAQPEISFQLANGKVIRGAGNKSKTGTIKDELEAYYFSFNKELDLQINSDEIKLNVGEKGADGKWVVKPEFVESFGFLNNAPVKTGRAGRKEGGPKLSASDLAANYIMQMIKESSL